MKALRGATLPSPVCSKVKGMGTPVRDAAARDAEPGLAMFLAAAKALGATVDGESTCFERDARRFSAAWITPGKDSPPRVRFATPAGPLARPPTLEARARSAPLGGPFRDEPYDRLESPAPLKLRLENKLDRTGKWLRINRETQTGDPAFDERIYLECEAPEALVLAALTSSTTRAGVLTCLTLGCTAIELDNDGNLVAELALTTKAMVAPTHLTSLLDALGAAAEAIPPLQGKGHHQSWAGFIPLLGGLGLIASWPLFYLVDWLWEPLGSDLYATAALGGLVLWVVSLPILFVILRGRSVSLRDFVISAIVAAIGFPLGGADLLLTLNGLLDSSAPEPHATMVVGLYQTTGKNSSSHLTLRSWHPGEATIAIKIGSSLYATLSRGESVTVTTRRGFLGWERVISIVPTTSPQTSN